MQIQVSLDSAWLDLQDLMYSTQPGALASGSKAAAVISVYLEERHKASTVWHHRLTWVLAGRLQCDSFIPSLPLASVPNAK